VIYQQLQVCIQLCQQCDFFFGFKTSIAHRLSDYVEVLLLCIAGIIFSISLKPIKSTASLLAPSQQLLVDELSPVVCMNAFFGMGAFFYTSSKAFIVQRCARFFNDQGSTQPEYNSWRSDEKANSPRVLPPS
jgi:hypothetical protein